MRMIHRILCVVVLAGALVGCMKPGDGVGLEQNGLPLSSNYFKSQVVPIFTNHCIQCHSAPFGMGYGQTGLTLEADSAYALLVNKVAQETNPDGLTQIRVVPGKPDSSLLYLKIVLDMPPSGSRMPLGQGPLSQDQIDVIKTWINAGAPR